jgi:glyoxylase-like metal-dependent hydrolase (beta-lactamase superfamily II)
MDSGFHRFNLGVFECTVIDADTQSWPSEAILGTVPEGLRRQALHAAGYSPEALVLGYNYMLIVTGKRRVLIDSGSGNDNFLQNLRAAGIKPENIDTLVITHADSDHIGGLIDTSGQIVFVNARHLVLRDAWNLYTSETFMENSQGYWAGFAHEVVPPLKDYVDVLEPGEEILPGIVVVEASGHRIGHFALHIFSEDENLLHVADAIHHPVFLAHPGWQSDFDEYPELAKQTRSRLFAFTEGEQSLVFVPHFAYPGLGYLLSEGESWKWRPVKLQKEK